MATYDIAKLPDEAIIIFTTHADHNVMTEGQQTIGEVVQLADEQSDPVGLICDLTNFNADFPGLTLAAALVTLGESPLFHHPNITVVAVVSQDQTIHLIMENLSTDTYGNAQVITVETLDEALAYVRTQLA